ncbi:MAG: MoaD/ThiS family protein [Sphingobacteriales bacterium]|jgi:molybdopterin synthase sulfur carrier subunit
MLKILVFGQLREIIGSSVIEVDNVMDTTALHHRLIEVYPALVNYTFRIAVDGKLTDGQVPIFPGCTIALLPPFSGG